MSHGLIEGYMMTREIVWKRACGIESLRHETSSQVNAWRFNDPMR